MATMRFQESVREVVAGFARWLDQKGDQITEAITFEEGTSSFSIELSYVCDGNSFPRVRVVTDKVPREVIDAFVCKPSDSD